MGINKEIVRLEKNLQMPSVRGRLQYLVGQRNILAHEDPFMGLEDYSTAQIDKITHELQQQWRGSKERLTKESPAAREIIDLFSDLVLDIINIIPFVQVIGLMLIGYPSLVDKLLCAADESQKLLEN